MINVEAIVETSGGAIALKTGVSVGRQGSTNFGKQSLAVVFGSVLVLKALFGFRINPERQSGTDVPARFSRLS
jgi:hypothetical protein